LNRMSQSLVLVLLGGAVLRISAFSTTYLNYVKPGFRPFLIAAGAAVLVLGVIGLVQEWRRPRDQEATEATAAGTPVAATAATAFEGPATGTATLTATDEAAATCAPAGAALGDQAGDDRHESHGGHAEHEGHGHDHAHGPRVAWLMSLPVFAIFLIAPPALGSYAAAREDTPPPPPRTLDAYAPLSGADPAEMSIGEFLGRAWGDQNRSLEGKQVKLTGFVSPSKKKGQWYVTRMQLACCAADAFALKVAVLDAPAPPRDTWVEVTGTWVPPKDDKIPLGTVAPELTATDVREVNAPSEPYE
jgi:uncharacterized repeat protein (TIGR03943 family)